MNSKKDTHTQKKTTIKQTKAKKKKNHLHVFVSRENRNYAENTLKEGTPLREVYFVRGPHCTRNATGNKAQKQDGHPLHQVDGVTITVAEHL